MDRFSVNDRTLTELDFVRIDRLRRQGAHQRVDDLLDAASVVPSREVSPDVVTMYSQVLLRFHGEGSDERRHLTLCYPSDAEPADGFVSVLSPIGLALLGVRVGEQACWHTPAGQLQRAEVVALLFQPEASGDYTT